MTWVGHKPTTEATCMLIIKKNSGPPCSAYFCRKELVKCLEWVDRKSWKIWAVYSDETSTWTIPPGRPPRSSSRLSDFSQSAATICIKVPFAFTWEKIIIDKIRTADWDSKHFQLKNSGWWQGTIPEQIQQSKPKN